MNKVWVLYRNELYKLFRAKKMLILLIVLLLIPFATRLMFGQNYYMEQISSTEIFTAEEMIDKHRGSMESRRMEMRDMVSYGEYEGLEIIAHAYDNALEEFATLSASNPQFAGRAYMLELLSTTHVAEVLLDPVAAGYENKDLPEDLFADREFVLSIENWIHELTLDRAGAERLYELGRQALEDQSVASYASFKIERIEQDLASYPYSDSMIRMLEIERSFYEDVQASNSMSDLELYNPEYIYRRLNTLQTIASLELSLETGRDTETQGGGPLLPSREQEITDELAMARYIHDQGALLGDPEYNSWALQMDQGRNYFLYAYIMIMFILLIYVGVQAGSLVSQEIESGSIKLLIIAPVYRWKMYLAKIMALGTLIVFLITLAFGWTLIWAQVFFGGDGIMGYTGVYDGQVYALSFLQQAGLDILGLTVKLGFYSLLALMISSLFRKSALAVGISIGVAFADFIGTLIYFNAEWRYWFRYMPFTNLDLGNIRFTSLVSQYMRFDPSNNLAYNHNLAFSLIYIVVFAGLFIWAGMDAFTKRDI